MYTATLFILAVPKRVQAYRLYLGALSAPPAFWRWQCALSIAWVSVIFAGSTWVVPATWMTGMQWGFGLILVVVHTFKPSLRLYYLSLLGMVGTIAGVYSIA